MSKKNHVALQVLLLITFSIFFSGCKTTAIQSPTANTIIGTWEGCDGRLITFKAIENGEMVGRYTALGNLGRYGFEQNEIGYRVRRQNPGVYNGTVKWRSANGNANWKKVTITINGDTYQDDGSDGCSKEMKRVGRM